MAREEEVDEEEEEEREREPGGKARGSALTSRAETRSQACLRRSNRSHRPAWILGACHHRDPLLVTCPLGLGLQCSRFRLLRGEIAGSEGMVT